MPPHSVNLLLVKTALVTLCVFGYTVLASASLLSPFSVQAAEAMALTEACKLGKDQCAAVYTDSRYPLGVVHDFGNLVSKGWMLAMCT